MDAFSSLEIPISGGLLAKKVGNWSISCGYTYIVVVSSVMVAKSQNSVIDLLTTAYGTRMKCDGLYLYCKFGKMEV